INSSRNKGSFLFAPFPIDLNTFTEALEAFRTAMSYRFFDWLTLNRDVFAAYKASLGFIWA
ncbi:MAG: hypothetical protein HWQ41_00335, partial [Nostoc sp. NOS(2021)]|uniref:hypothetical protein n=1 Tax=Nostoc sp. NOS(2021) TaxID=2815407 RepID=UPI0025FDEB5F